MGFKPRRERRDRSESGKMQKKSDAELVKILSLVNTMVECSRMSEPCNGYVSCFDLRLLEPGCFKKSIHNL